MAILLLAVRSRDCEPDIHLESAKWRIDRVSKSTLMLASLEFCSSKKAPSRMVATVELRQPAPRTPADAPAEAEWTCFVDASKRDPRRALTRAVRELRHAIHTTRAVHSNPAHAPIARVIHPQFASM